MRVGRLMLGLCVGVGVMTFLSPNSASASTAPDVSFVPLPDYGGDVAVAPDSTVMVLSTYDVTRIAPDGTASVQRVASAGTVLTSMALDASGNLWLAASGSGGGAPELVRVTPARVITRFPLPVSAGNANDIAVGSDGDIWFAPGGFVGQLGRLRPDGTFEMTDVPYASIPDNLVPDANGSMWFTTLDPPGIGRVRPSGEVTTFPLGSTRIRQAVMCMGPDGRLWAVLGVTPYFTNPAKHDLVRVSLTGDVERTTLDFSSTFSSTEVTGITTTPDSTVWIARSEPGTPGDLSFLTPISNAAAHTEINVRGLQGRAPHRLAGAADGSIWFTSRLEPEVGHYRDTPLPPPELPEAPVAIMLPVTATGVFLLYWHRQRRRRTRDVLRPRPG